MPLIKIISFIIKTEKNLESPKIPSEIKLRTNRRKLPQFVSRNIKAPIKSELAEPPS